MSSIFIQHPWFPWVMGGGGSPSVITRPPLTVKRGIFSSLRFGGLKRTFCPLMQPEVSQSESALRLWAWVFANQKKLIQAVVGATVLGLVVYAYLDYQEGKEIKASEALSNVMPVRLKEAPTPAELAKSYLKVAADNVGTRAATHATLRAASALFQAGSYADAQAQFEKFLREDPGSPFAAQAAFGIAACMDAAGKGSEALAKYEEITKRYPSESVADQAKLATATLYASQNKPDQAYKLLDEMIQTGRGTFIQEAFQKHEELAQQFPYLRTNSAAMKPATPSLTPNPAPAPAAAAPKPAAPAPTPAPATPAKP